MNRETQAAHFIQCVREARFAHTLSPMPHAPYVHGSTDDTEVARLVTQAAFVAAFSLCHFDATQGMQVLDLGTGVGAMAAQLAQRFPGIELTGLDFSEAQLARARVLHPVARYVQGNAMALPFADASFDRVHCTWVLEHVAEPVRILREVRRVLKPGGYAHILEVDNGTLRVTPPLPAFTQTFEAMNAAQIRAGGDPFIGRVLAQLFVDAGFREPRAQSISLHGHYGSPAFYAEMLEEFAAICESLDEALPPELVHHARSAAKELRARINVAGSSLTYEAMLVHATR
jgi:ubiquinone/menaquinone biosynthesis C-methylase UbiE